MPLVGCAADSPAVPNIFLASLRRRNDDSVEVRVGYYGEGIFSILHFLNRGYWLAKQSLIVGIRFRHLCLYGEAAGMLRYPRPQG